MLSNLEGEAALGTQLFDRLIIGLNIVNNKFDWLGLAYGFVHPIIVA